MVFYSLLKVSKIFWQKKSLNSLDVNYYFSDIYFTMTPFVCFMNMKSQQIPVSRQLLWCRKKLKVWLTAFWETWCLLHNFRYIKCRKEKKIFRVLSFIAERRSYKAWCFHYHDSEKTWFDAGGTCSLASRKLVTIKNIEERQNLNQSRYVFCNWAKILQQAEMKIQL